MADEEDVNKAKPGSMDKSSPESETEMGFLLPGCKTLEQFTQSGFGALMNAIKASNSLPCGNDWDYYSSYPVFQKAMDIKGKKVLKLMSMVFEHQGIKGNILRRDLEEKFDLLLDANDMILERVNSILDELAGIKRNPQPVLLEVSPQPTKPVSGSWNRTPTATNSRQNSGSPQTLRLLTAKNIQRPQINFKDKIDNRSLPFEPKIKDKPNSLKPLAIYLEENAEGEESFNHPYQYELELFVPKEWQLTPTKPIMYKPLSDTPLVFVEQPEQLDEMLKDLRQQTEIAVDIEQHSYRSFQGFTCLIQISTREKDYIIDTFTLRHCLQSLNEVFTNSNIVKVLHGADHDIEWLQRDFSVYMVNMFDTHQAARLLHFAHLSLAFLLKHYCNINVDKKFQLADWRIRPLPQEMINYARGDTHYLLYVYDKLRCDLIAAANGQSNLLKSVIQRSTELCLKKYEKPVFSDDVHLNIVQKTKKLLNNRQMFALKELAAWRNKVAREEDESLGYVLPNHMLLQISETLPREIQGILACCNPIPPLVRQNLVNIHQKILLAREQPLVKVVSQEEVDLARAAATTRSSGLDPLNSPLLCPHDLSHASDYRDDLSTLLEDSKGKDTTPLNSPRLNGLPSHVNSDESPSIAPKGSATVTAFGYEAFKEEEDSKAAFIKNLKNLVFLSPYQRYKMVKPFMESLDSTEQAAVEPQQEDDPSKEVTDEERVNRIKEHFLKLVKTIPKPEEPVQPTPVKQEQGDILRKQIPRKRKRDKNDAKSNVDSTELIEVAENSDDESPVKLPKQTVVKKELDSRSNQGKNVGKIIKAENKSVKVEKSSSLDAFDYSKVDFSRFQGGSAADINDLHKSRGTEKYRAKVKSKFKWKGKQNNLSMTYKNHPKR